MSELVLWQVTFLMSIKISWTFDSHLHPVEPKRICWTELDSLKVNVFCAV